MNPHDALTINYDGTHWQALDAENNMMTLLVAEDAFLPTLPEGAVVHNLVLPVEQLLHRTFSLPFANPKFIDQDILVQELEDHTSEASDSWWLSWQAGQSDDGVAGMMIGIPESLRQQIDEADEVWSQVQHVGSDIWLRLNQQLSIHSFDQAGEEPADHLFEASADEFDMPQSRHIAVFDADTTGVFFGVWQGADESVSNGDGFWQGMRRLNWSETGEVNEQSASFLEDIQRSLHSMGWQDDSAIATGRLSAPLFSALGLPVWHGQLYEADDLPSRRDATMAVAGGENLNFRHGRWRAGSNMQQFKPWYRSLALAAGLMLMWSVGMMWQNHQLEQQLLTHQQRIIDAFHAGLPQEKVMIDALAQLRKATGGNNTTGAKQSGNNHASQWLQHLQNIARVHQQTAWEIKELSFQDGRMMMTGLAKDLATMNRIQQLLQQQSGQNVKLQDTDLSGNQVRFKMVWS